MSDIVGLLAELVEERLPKKVRVEHSHRRRSCIADAWAVGPPRFAMERNMSGTCLYVSRQYACLKKAFRHGKKDGPIITVSADACRFTRYFGFSGVSSRAEAA
jgi:hypothetical protein